MQRIFTVFAAVAVAFAATAEEPQAGKLRLRTVLHDPLRGQAELYVRDAGGSLVPLYLAREGLSEAQLVSLNEKALELYKSPEIDPENPLEQLAARVAVPKGVSRGIVLIVPSGKETGPAYRMMLINDDPKVFKKGESRVLNLTSLSMAMKAGEHSGKLPPAAMTPIPPVKERNDLNQAQTSFYQKGESEDEWLLVAERPMQFTDTVRNIILIYGMPNSKMPRLRTLIDTELR